MTVTYGEKQAGETVILHPTVENMLEDAMVMIGLYVLKDEELYALADPVYEVKRA